MGDDVEPVSGAHTAGYNEWDRERFLPEEHKNRRSDFARDRARLLHSGALRRLAAKTQVLSPTAGLDFARNRLTHSLEVAQVGRELATSLGLDPDVVDTACLAHDIGHPPFGHNGESALNAWAHDIGGFEGNAQTLRLLTRLEPKVFGRDGTSYGVNLTRASLDASCKYPWPADRAQKDPSGRAKFGFYADDTAVFEWLRIDAPEGVRCIEAQVMDLSDDIAYSVHDFEDAVVAGYLDLSTLATPGARADLIPAIDEWAGGEISRDALRDACGRLADQGVWAMGWDGSRLAHARLKNLTSQLIGRFVHAAIHVTKEAFSQRSLQRFGASVVVPDGIHAEIAVLKGVVAAFVMSTDARQSIYGRQRELLTQLADSTFASGPELLETSFRDDWNTARSDAERRRVVVDQIASLTDQSAIAWVERGPGQ